MKNPVLISNLIAVVIGFLCGYFFCKIKVRVKKHDIRNVLYGDTE